tara:strand:+ start:13901 stop:14050 length:150 start_codon:yes stop_codon:yes gene_type:complete
MGARAPKGFDSGRGDVVAQILFAINDLATRLLFAPFFGMVAQSKTGEHR